MFEASGIVALPYATGTTPSAPLAARQIQTARSVLRQAEVTIARKPPLPDHGWLTAGRRIMPHAQESRPTGRAHRQQNHHRRTAGAVRQRPRHAAATGVCTADVRLRRAGHASPSEAKKSRIDTISKNPAPKKAPFAAVPSGRHTMTASAASASTPPQTLAADTRRGGAPPSGTRTASAAPCVCHTSVGKLAA
jgi:hypothetical protein